jgi:sulfatase maturation enzyme AslB (radical SAM superfamily)
MVMGWNCAAIDHGITIFPNGKIGPCCQIDFKYLKSADQITDPNRFQDLNTEHPPEACNKCVATESQGRPSYREMFNKIKKPTTGIQFLDIRNSNFCNLKCRYCGPHFSSQWAQELDNNYKILNFPIPELEKIIADPALSWIYFTGGEPLINQEYWDLLDSLIAQNKNKNITLMYNSNLTTIQFKDKNIVKLWKKFKQVTVNVSVDTTDQHALNYIRSGADWKKIQKNIQILLANNVKIVLTPVISVLNIWFVKNLFEYGIAHNISVAPIILEGPDYLALDVIPDELKQLALCKIDELSEFLDKNTYNTLRSRVENNINQCLFPHTISHVMLLDKLRNENLFELLPFDNLAKTIFLKNYEQ